MNSVHDFFNRFKETFLKNSELLFEDTESWYDITVLCVLLGLYFIKNSLNETTKILAIAKVQNYRQIEFKRLLGTLENYNIAIVINTEQSHYSALFLKKSGDDKIALFNDPFGTDTPDYIVRCCREIGYHVINNRIRIQAPNDSFNCGPLVINTLMKFALDIKIRTTRNLLQYANTWRKNDQALLKEFGIHTPEELSAFYSEQIHNMVMNDADSVSENRSQDLFKKTRHDMFVYDNYDSKIDLKSLQWKTQIVLEEQKAYENADNNNEVYVQIKNTEQNEKDIFNDIFDNIYQKVKRTKRSQKNKYCKEGNFIQWIKLKNKDYFVLSNTATDDDVGCKYSNTTEKKNVFLPISKNQRQGLQKFIYIKKKIQRSMKKLSIKEPRIIKEISFKNIGFY